MVVVNNTKKVPKKVYLKSFRHSPPKNKVYQGLACRLVSAPRPQLGSEIMGLSTIHNT